jgi:hypothetical protein
MIRRDFSNFSAMYPLIMTGRKPCAILPHQGLYHEQLLVHLQYSIKILECLALAHGTCHNLVLAYLNRRWNCPTNCTLIHLDLHYRGGS